MPGRGSLRKRGSFRTLESTTVELDGGARLRALSIVRISTIQRDHSILKDALKGFFRQWWVLKKVACVASVSDRVIARTMDRRERAKKRGDGGGGKEIKGLLSTTSR